MRCTRPLVLALAAVVVGGCAHKTTRPTRRATPQEVYALSNAQAYDSYYVRRTDELASTGKYSRAQASQIAEHEAIDRYGPRTTGTSPAATMYWPSTPSNTLSYEEIDAALKKAGR